MLVPGLVVKKKKKKWHLSVSEGSFTTSIYNLYNLVQIIERNNGWGSQSEHKALFH